jgi:hypothetical protein
LGSDGIVTCRPARSVIVNGYCVARAVALKPIVRVARTSKPATDGIFNIDNFASLE